ncbi:MAG TPA: hypothetical protein VGQ57_15925 [Polyangiaceae bacterium]|nr:hypothetical protein [Polyangiaceae bacterium]
MTDGTGSGSGNGATAGTLPAASGGSTTGTGGSSSSDPGGTGGSAVLQGGSGGNLAQGGTGADGTGPLCDVLAVLQRECVSCHANPPLKGVPMPLVTYEDLVRADRTTPTITVAEASIARMKDPDGPMPPAPATPASATDIAALQAWLDAGKPSVCDPAAGGAGAAGAAGSTGTVDNPYDTPVTCTSDQHWTRGNEESANMHPGAACIDCHTSGGEEEGPRFTFAGTVFPTAHEPTDCNGLNGGADSAEVVVVDANGTTFTMKVNSVGNFSYEARGAAVVMPYHAKVVVGGQERVMAEAQKSGDCNSCHTESGTQDAPGRIMAP